MPFKKHVIARRYDELSAAISQATASDKAISLNKEIASLRSQ